jgi:putative acetyltransferase
MDLVFSAFSRSDQEEARRLVLAGLGEHWGNIDPTRNPDLNDIAVSYAESFFLVARLDGRLVGTGALVPRGEEAEIVRMSVARDLRRQGIGRQILSRLVEQARRSGFLRIYLETTAAWQEVIDFYLDAGFAITHYQDGDVYFSLDLSATLDHQPAHPHAHDDLPEHDQPARPGSLGKQG